MKCRLVKQFSLISLICFSMMGCVTPKYQSQNVNLSGFPIEYRTGYDDGCSSVKYPLLQKKDTDRYKIDKLYAQGWKDGYDLCKKGSDK